MRALRAGRHEARICMWCVSRVAGAFALAAKTIDCCGGARCGVSWVDYPSVL